MIAVRLIGGLGNQMFQYAAARALADRLGTDLVLDPREFAHYTLHAYGLEDFCVRARRGEPADFSRFPEWQRKLFSRLRWLNPGTRFYAEPSFAFDPAWNSLAGDLLVSGYFQSERYFLPSRTALLADFHPRKPLGARNEAVAAEARGSESVMIHVRRGNYVTDARTLSIHGVCSPDYYRAAIVQLRAECANPRFFVFSNDMQWSRENLPLGDDAVFVEGNGDAPEMDIHLMAQCRHHIIANSSFSWWGAWLADTPGQVVIAPDPWFDAPGMAAPDLLPGHWRRIGK